MYRISKEFHFSASHQLHGLSEGHPCGRVHGHNYIVRISLQSETVDEHGFVVDYNDLKAFGEWLDGALDHQHLNDVLPMQPTAENMARLFVGVIKKHLPLPDGVQVSVAVSETPKTWAEWSE
jgi:6-pyruvoyltetrahydropterin/6-carboxytetrahydropterin synthase